MRIAGAASAFPQHYYPQEELTQALLAHWGPQMEEPRLLVRLHEHCGVDGRHLVLPLEEYIGLQSWGQANAKWIEAATDLGEQALRLALERSGLDACDIGAIFFVSVTGVASPSIDARLVNRMKLRADIKRIPIFGLGCVAGAAGIARAADYVRAFPDQIAALVSVEICSLTIQRDDMSTANLISSGLFGDGAGSVVVAGANRQVSGPRILATQSSFYPETERAMGWDISEKGFQIVLSREVPQIIRQYLRTDAERLLAANGIRRDQIESWILHTGGPKILEATEAALHLHSGQLQASWDCLRRAGNLSSASVLMVLEEVMRNRRPAAGSYGVLAAMGPGFCSEILLLQW
ncbi:MAG: type III polyketide synthase [Candidatus Solibacter usitatus]|nr:type III polyketide synthase [Candidatus Solibacter usitatus]